MESALLALALLALGVLSVLPLRRALRTAPAPAQRIARFGFACLALSISLPFFVAPRDALDIAVVVFGLYGFVAHALCLGVATVIAVAARRVRS